MAKIPRILAALAVLAVALTGCTSEGTVYSHRDALYGRARVWAAEQEAGMRAAGYDTRPAEVALAQQFYETALGEEETERGTKIP